MFTSSTKLFQGITPATSAAGYQIARSLRFNSADSANLTRTPASAGNRKTWTWSGWVKRSNLGGANPSLFGCYSGTGNPRDALQFATDIIEYAGNTSGSSFDVSLKTTQVFRDASAWYHIVFAADTTQATASNRIKIYVNGVQITDFSTATYPTLNVDLPTNQAQIHYLGASLNGNYFDGYITEVNFIDGQALTPSSFGENDAATGVWAPKAYTGTYGTNGFYVNFSDNSGTTSTTLGKDYSGNGNNWTPNNFSVTAGAGNDSLVDSPTNYGTDTGAGGEVRGNYATLNPLATVSSLSSITVANGNLQLDYTRTGGQSAFGKATIALPSSGKFYYEVNIISASSTPSNIPAFDTGLVSATAFSVSSTGGLLRTIYLYDGTKFDGTTYSTYGAAFAAGDVVNIAVDMDNGRIYFGKNGDWGNGAGAFNQTFGSATAAFTDLISSGYTWNPGTWISGGTAGSYYFNFGQRPFSYTAPSGFKALCTQNLPTPTVGASSTTLADDYFNIALYTGNGTAIGSGGKAVTGLGFQPDLVWIKGISGATDHSLFDAVRGTTKLLESNTADAESTQSESLTTFGTDGFTVGSLAQVNTNTATYVGWAWKANGAGSSNTAGSITSTVSANQTAGISIVTYTGNGTSGATVGHGLGVAPRMVITKKREAGGSDGWWATYHASLSANTNLMLNSTSAAAGTASWTQGIIGGVSSSTFTLTSGGLGAANVNDNTYDYVAYCFAEVEGFSKFGSYTGNGSADGPFVYCGFRPRYVMIKRTDTTSNWVVIDTARDTYNAAGLLLRPNVSDAESDDRPEVDILSNGLKWRDTTAALNASGGTYIFMAFAESPFNYSRAR